MDTLASVFVVLGFGEIQTYIQSGNVLFYSDEKDSNRLTDMITHAIHHQLQIDVVVQIKTAAQWSQIIKQCPYSK